MLTVLYLRLKKRNNSIQRAYNNADVASYVQVTARRTYGHADEEFTSQTRTHSLSAHAPYIHMLHSLVVCVTTGVFSFFTLIKSKTKYSNNTAEWKK